MGQKQSKTSTPAHSRTPAQSRPPSAPATPKRVLSNPATPVEVIPFRYDRFENLDLAEDDRQWSNVVAGQFAILRRHISATCFSDSQGFFTRAIVLDLDDTIFTGSYTVPGAVEFVEFVMQHPAQFSVIVITARHESERAQTLADLEGIGISLRLLAGKDELHLVPKATVYSPPSEFKHRIRKELWKRRISIVACVGDKYADLDPTNGVFNLLIMKRSAGDYAPPPNLGVVASMMTPTSSRLTPVNTRVDHLPKGMHGMM